MKILMLVISSDTFPVYARHRTVWRRYMHSHPDIDCYFIQYSPYVRVPTIQQDTLFLRGVERYGTIAIKTVEALEYFLARKSYDYVVRTNLSSVWDFRNLVAHLETSPRSRLYSGQLGEHQSNVYASGCGFIMSIDVARLLFSYAKTLGSWTHIPDDVAIAICLQHSGIQPTTQARVDFLSLSHYTEHHDKIPPGTFHYRMKHADYVNAREEEPQMMNRLLDDHILR